MVFVYSCDVIIIDARDIINRIHRAAGGSMLEVINKCT